MLRAGGIGDTAAEPESPGVTNWPPGRSFLTSAAARATGGDVRISDLSLCQQRSQQESAGICHHAGTVGPGRRHRPDPIMQRPWGQEQQTWSLRFQRAVVMIMVMGDVRVPLAQA